MSSLEKTVSFWLVTEDEDEASSLSLKWVSEKESELLKWASAAVDANLKARNL